MLVFGGVGILLVDGRLDGGAALHAVQGILANLAVDGQLVVLLEHLDGGDGGLAVFAIDLAIVIAQIAQQGLHHLDGGGIVGFIGLEGSGNGVAALEHSHGLGANLAVHSQAVIALEIAHGSGGGIAVFAIDFAAVIAVGLQQRLYIFDGVAPIAGAKHGIGSERHRAGGQRQYECQQQRNDLFHYDIILPVNLFWTVIAPSE